MKQKQLSIRLQGIQVGILHQLPSGKMTFSYDATATMPISVGMPIREKSYGSLECEAYFGGLLPESETVKKIIGKMFGVSPNNSFALLRVIGHDCAGAISCHGFDEPITPQKSIPLSGKIITEKELYQHIKELPNKPLFLDLEGLRLSLAGVQDKAAVCMIDNHVALAEHGCPTTHILKPSSKHFEGIAENEYLCMKIANQIGLPVPEIELRRIKDIIFLLINRYDRKTHEGHVQRIHQEDFCQALGILTSRKYQNEGGPGFRDCFGLLNKTMHPAIDRNHLATAAVFNFLIGNMDAHGKNFSLLHNNLDNIRLAPFYDIICTRVYPALTVKMAMKIGSQYNANYIVSRYWEELCKEINYNYSAMVKLIEKTGTQIVAIAELEKQKMKDKGFHHPIVNNMINFLKKNIDQTLK